MPPLLFDIVAEHHVLIPQIEPPLVFRKGVGSESFQAHARTFMPEAHDFLGISKISGRESAGRAWRRGNKFGRSSPYCVRAVAGLIPTPNNRRQKAREQI